MDVKDVDDVTPVKKNASVPEKLRSCHTAQVGKYVVEGHVPASVVKRLLAERPRVLGIAVAGMPVGSPGMEGANPERYQVMAFKADGSSTVYATIEPTKN